MSSMTVTITNNPKNHLIIDGVSLFSADICFNASCGIEIFMLNTTFVLQRIGLLVSVQISCRHFYSATAGNELTQTRQISFLSIDFVKSHNNCRNRTVIFVINYDL